MKNIKITLMLLVLLGLAQFCCGEEGSSGKDYIAWLEERSMLAEASSLAEDVSGKGLQWEHPYAMPQTDEVIRASSAWFVAYPSSTITKEGSSILSTLAGSDEWEAFKTMGLEAMHTGPLKRAGGIKGKEYTPTVDGWFDRISLEIDPKFGTEEEYKALVAEASKAGAIIVGDVIPGHTGKGFDFRLAERGYKDYPGLYSMVEISEEDWHLLPEVPGGSDSVNLSKDQVDSLTSKGYIPGELERVLFSVPGKTGLTGWDATPIIEGADGKKRRWVYLHYFRPGQPTLNWLDPSFAANRLVSGDIVKTRLVLGAKVIRLDANPFLGIEPKPGSEKCFSEGHPLSIVASDSIAMQMRKLGGWSFQELNLGLGDIAKFSKNGPDLSYDFITRPAYNHALLTGDASLLKLVMQLMDKYGITNKQLIHAMQNHDEVTYELVHFTEHADDTFDFGGEEMTGKAIRELVIGQMHDKAVGSAAPYNKLSGNGLCTTYTGFCAAAFGVKDPYNMTDAEKEQVKKGHLLMVVFNAMQGGVFAISGWDLVGALPLKTDEIPDLVKDGDYRWVNRGAYDLMDVAPEAKTSPEGMPKAQALYGPIPDQLKDPDSFASKVKDILEIRKAYGIDRSEITALPVVKSKGVVVMVNKLPEGEGIQVTAINFGRGSAREIVDIKEAKGYKGIDLLTGTDEGNVLSSGKFGLNLEALESKVILFAEKAEEKKTGSVQDRIDEATEEKE